MANGSRWFVFRGSELLVRMEGSTAAVPEEAEWSPLELPAGRPVAVRDSCWTAEVAAEIEPPAGMAFLGLRKLWGVLDEEAWRIAGRAVQILEWDRSHRFCGRCGHETKPEATELSRTCPRCGQQHFPRLSPAVIVRVERGEEILLARSPHFAPGVYSTLAGFVEPGESLEETVHREILEEVGITVTNLRYFGSQPWPFPHSLMIGFVADYESGEIRPQPGEIEDAGWFTAGALPGLPSALSIARALIDDFLARAGSDQKLIRNW